MLARCLGTCRAPMTIHASRVRVVTAYFTRLAPACSGERQQQALLVAAATCSALEALPPAACRLGVFSPAFSLVGPWLSSHPNAVRNSPIMLRQLLKLGVLALERWLQARLQLPVTAWRRFEPALPHGALCAAAASSALP